MMVGRGVDDGCIALPFSYGVFQSYYAALDLFKGQGGIAAVGTSTLVRPF